MKVTLNQQKITLSDILGNGGEATVFRHNGQAVKVYTQPTAARAAKLQAMMAHVGALPSEVIAPQALVYDAKGKQVIGFTMRLLEAEYSELRKVSIKSYRASSGYSTLKVARLFSALHRTVAAVHAAGMIVGDFNDLNVMFHDEQALLIDVDSFQFDVYPCMVGTEAFLDPALYGHDLSVRPLFTTDHDWYSFAVLLCKSLLLTHPYGGTHATLPTLTLRAQSRVSAFDATVQYPRIAYPPTLLDDGLAAALGHYFTLGHRGIFPLAALQAYAHGLAPCPHCGAQRPAARAICPLCGVAISVSIPVPTTRVTAADIAAVLLLDAGGPIVAWHLSDGVLSVIAIVNGQAVLVTSDGRRVQLFEAYPQARYAIMGKGTAVAVAPTPTRDDLYILDTSGAAPRAIAQTSTARFGGTLPMFGAHDQALYRISGGYLMRGNVRYGQWVEQAVMSVSERQTWFTVAPDQACVFGYFRALDGLFYWLLNGEQRVDVTLSTFAADEFLLELAAYFTAHTVLILRRTQRQGVERLYIDEIDTSGRALASHRLDGAAAAAYPTDGYAYMRGMLVYASDQGIVQETFNRQTFAATRKVFAQTEPFVQGGDGVAILGEALLAVAETRAYRLRG
jgi:hypothetical protein